MLYLLQLSLIVLFVTTGSISIASFATVIGAPVGIASAGWSLAFSISTWIVEDYQKKQEIKNKKHDAIVMLARSKVDRKENNISEALINKEISHEDFIRIINEEKNFL